MNENLKAPGRGSWYVLIGILVAMLMLIGAVCTIRVLGNMRAIERSQAQLAQLHRIDRAAMQIESGVRGYLITADPAYLVTYRRGVAALDPALTALADPAGVGPGRARMRATLSRLAARRRQIAETTIERARTRSARALLSRNGGLRASEALLRHIDSMREVEEGRLATLRSQQRQSILASSSLIALTIMLLCVGIYTAWRANRATGIYQTALRDSEDRYRRLLEIGTPYVLEMRDGIVIDMSDPTGKLLEGSRADIVGKSASDLFPDTGSPVIAAMLPALSTGVTSSQMERDTVTSLTGTRRAVEARGISFMEQGRLTMMIALRDLTDQLQLEEQLAHFQRLESLGKLTGGVAHDFNNLLTIVFGNAETLEAHAEARHDGDAAELAFLIRQAAQHGAELTQRLLAFARRQPLVMRSVDVADHLAKLQPMLRTVTGASSLRVVACPDTARVYVDAAQLDDAIVNLAVNAVAAMPDGGLLTIEAENVVLDHSYAAWNADVTPGRYVRISVSDTGVGMDAATVARAFEPFFTTKPAGQGSGMGLSMVYGLLKQIGGHAKIYSEVGEGTTVNLYLPVAPEDAVPEPVAESTALEADVGNERILLVEDNAMVLAHVSRQLHELGYRIVTATSAEAALTLIEAEEYDLLFTDVVMPGGMNGRKLADEAKRLRPAMPVLFTSGYTENAIVHSGRLDEGVMFLAKPYGRAELGRAIRDALSTPPQ